MKQNKLTRHHKLARAVWGTSHYDNIEKKRDAEHRAHHLLYGIQTPHEQISSIIDVTGKAFNSCFASDILSVIEDYELEEIYNSKCVNVQKLVQALLKT